MENFTDLMYRENLINFKKYIFAINLNILIINKM